MSNKLQYVTYTSQRTGKTIPVVTGFTSKEDERIPYIALLDQPKAKKGKKAKKEQEVDRLAYCTFSMLPLGKDGERIPCVIWGADPRWHDIAKRTAEIINDPYTLTQEDYDDLLNRAKAVFMAKKEEGKKDEPKDEKQQPKKEPVKPRNASAPKKEEPKPKAKKQTSASVQEVSTTATKKTGKIYTAEQLMAACEQVAKDMGVNKKNRSALEEFLKSVIEAA